MALILIFGVGVFDGWKFIFFLCVAKVHTIDLSKAASFMMDFHFRSNSVFALCAPCICVQCTFKFNINAKKESLWNPKWSTNQWSENERTKEEEEAEKSTKFACNEIYNGTMHIDRCGRLCNQPLIDMCCILHYSLLNCRIFQFI